MHPLKIYCLPVSGGQFPTQLGILCELYLAQRLINDDITSSRDYSPDLVLGSSGGNICSYVALAGQWSPNGIESVVRKMRNDMFVIPWVPYLPSWIVFPLTGSIFKPGYGTSSLFNNYFNSENIQNVEIWSGTYDENRKSAQMFCNKFENDCIIKGSDFNDLAHLQGCSKLKYLKGNVDKISKVSIASASIPYLTKGQLLDQSVYADGGVMYASPMGVFTRQIRDHILCNNKNLRIIYICSYNMENLREKYNYKSLESLIDGMILKDRNSCVDLLNSLCYNIEYCHYSSLNTCSLGNLLKSIENVEHYALFIYPKCNEQIELSSFINDDIINLINKARYNYGAHLWLSRGSGIKC